MLDWVASEKDKYDRIWRDKGGSYGASSPEKIFLSSRIPEVAFLDRRPWLVVGSGDGQGFRWLAAKGFDVKACDISDALAGTYPKESFECCPAHDMPYGNGYFGTVLCIDVIEHIPPEFVVPSLEEMKRVCCGSIYVQARCAESVFEPGLHLTVEGHNWWRDTFASIGPVVWSLREPLDESAEITCL